MEKISRFLSRYFETVPDWIRARRIRVWLFFMAATALAFVGMQKIKADNTVESWFSKQDPTFVAYNEYHAQFGSEDGLLIVYKAKDGDVFSARSLEAVRGIRDDLLNYRTKANSIKDSSLDHIVRVNSLINVPVLTVEDDLLVSKPLVGNAVPTSPEALDKIRKTAEAQRDLRLRYYSKDMQYGSIFVDTDFGAIPLESDGRPADEVSADDMALSDASGTDRESSGSPAEGIASNGSADHEEAQTPRFKSTDMKDYAALNKAVKAILAKPEYAGQFDFYPVGNTAESEHQDKNSQQLGLLYLAAFAIMIVLLFYLFRTLSAVIWPILIVLLTTVWTIGISGFFGITITVFIIITVFLLLTIGMAGSIHVQSTYLFYRKEGYDHEPSMRLAWKNVSVPCLLTSFTTMIGMLSCCTSPIVPIQVVGFMSSLGVAIAFFLTMYLLPAMLDLWSPVPKTLKRRKSPFRFADRLVPNFTHFLQGLLVKIVPAVEKRPIAFIMPFFLILVVCIYGITRAQVDSNILSMYPKDSKFTESVRLIDQKMAGSSKIALYMDFGEDDALRDPQVLNILEDLQLKLEEKYGKYVITTSSLVNVVKDTYQKLNEGKEEKFAVPGDPKVLAQTLFMLNNANPEERRRLVDNGYRKANITVTLRNGGSMEYNEAFANMQKDINASLEAAKVNYPMAKVSITGMFALQMKLNEFLTTTEITSLGFAFIVINILLVVIFGSLKAGIIAIIPNLIPSILIIGLMGLLDIPLDFFAIILSPIIIGISVDDTIHFLTHYRMEYSESGDIKSAITNTLKESGQGVVFTAMVLGIGFGILSISITPGIAKLGIFGSLAIFIGVLNDLFLLPALVLVFKLGFKETKAKPSFINEKVADRTYAH